MAGRTICTCGRPIGHTASCKDKRLCLRCCRAVRKRVYARKMEGYHYGRGTAAHKSCFVEAETVEEMHRWEARRMEKVNSDYERLAETTREYRPGGG